MSGSRKGGRSPPAGSWKPSERVNDMQKQTRDKQKFGEVEANLPEIRSAPASAAGAASQSTPAQGLLARLASFNPFSRNVSHGDVVWLFDNTAYPSRESGHWEAEFVAAVFENGPKEDRFADAVSKIAQQLGLVDDAEARSTIEKRLVPFLWNLQSSRIVPVEHRGREIRLGPTSFGGITSTVQRVARHDRGKASEARALVPRGATGVLEMQTFYAGAPGWSIISDVDDTIKVTMTSDPLGILRTTFVDVATPIKGMPELYSDVKALLPPDTPWFYLSASPYNLYPFLREFREKYYPQGTFILRDQSWRTLAGLLSTLTVGTEEYKVDRIKKIHSWLPKRKMILIGDSTQSDPEAYGEIYRAFPGWVKVILIRKATNLAEIGIDDKNKLERFEKAFEGVPGEAWHVFEDPDECRWVIRKAVRDAKGSE